ncbi:MAG TPA: hypothetical protein VEF04_22705, partial [Blastocatellia bacterium]|nr:hypothetical protein [Blastocatellia bacterium]
EEEEEAHRQEEENREEEQEEQESVATPESDTRSVATPENDDESDIADDSSTTTNMPEEIVDSQDSGAGFRPTETEVAAITLTNMSNSGNGDPPTARRIDASKSMKKSKSRGSGTPKAKRKTAAQIEQKADAENDDVADQFVDLSDPANFNIHKAKDTKKQEHDLDQEYKQLTLRFVSGVFVPSFQKNKDTVTMYLDEKREFGISLRPRRNKKKSDRHPTVGSKD